MRLLSDLHEKGIKAVLLPGGKIKLSPKDKITDDLREQIERHREELREELIKSMIDELTEELREDNKRNSRGLLIKFNILDDTIALTTPEHFEEVKKQGFVTYLPEELISLLIAGPKAWQLIHEIKKEFDGRIKNVGDKR